MQFALISENDLARQHFDQWPVWSEFYDFEQVSDIARWGIDPDAALELRESLNLGKDHAVYSVLHYSPLPDDHMRLFIRASFSTNAGLVLPGYVINSDAYAGCFFPDRQPDIMFNRHMGGDLLWAISRLSEHLGLSVSNIQPLQYDTGLLDEAGNRVRGVLEPASTEAKRQAAPA